MMKVDGVPNVRVCVEPARAGAVVEPQNVLGSLDRDLVSVVDKIGGPFTPVGFYYRTMIRPRRLWPVYEKVLRNLAGLGRVDKHGDADAALRHRAPAASTCSSSAAAAPASRPRARRRRAGERVLLVDENVARASATSRSRCSRPDARSASTRAGSSRSTPATCCYRVRAERIVVATGALEQPLVFPGNDLVGVMLPDGAPPADPRLRRSSPASARS